MLSLCRRGVTGSLILKSHLLELHLRLTCLPHDYFTIGNMVIGTSLLTLSHKPRKRVIYSSTKECVFTFLCSLSCA